MNREKLTIDWGYNIQQVIAKAIEQATLNNTEVETEFNGINVVVNSTTDQVALVRDFMNAHLMKWEEIGPNPPVEYSKDVAAQIALAKFAAEEELKARQAEYDRQREEKQADFDKAVEGIEMEISDNELWVTYLTKNVDSYGNAICVYAENWAKLMQKKMAEGQKIADIAGACSHLADTEGITGFMYGAAVSMLSRCWKHGEELRKWHNKEYNHEGEGVVNPAVIEISPKND